MKKLLLLLIITGSTFKAFSQNSYSVSWGTSTYDTLTNGTYLLPWDWGPTEFNFGFDFPFFDKVFSTVTMDIDGYGYFDMPSDHSINFFSGAFTASSTDSSRGYSYQSDTVNGMKVIKFQWKNVGVIDDLLSANPTDHKINFQAWFYEDGTIEAHFGEVDLSNSPYFTDTTGFIGLDKESYGPWIGIMDFDIEEAYLVSGTSINVSVITDIDSINIFYGVPAYGQYFRWKLNEWVGTEQDKTSMDNEFIVYPNPVRDALTIKTNKLNVNQVKLFDICGKLVLSQKANSAISKVDVSEFEMGLYYLSVYDDNNIIVDTKKVVIQ